MANSRPLIKRQYSFEPITSWYENGQKESERYYVDGERHGLTTFWYESGQKKFEINYVAGQHELVTSWYENGQKKCEVNYVDDKLQ